MKHSVGALAAPERQDWTSVWLAFGSVLVGLVAEWRFRNGWGKPTEWWLDHPERAESFVRAGYTLRPLNVMFQLGLLGLAVFHHYLSTGTDLLAIAALSAWGVTMLALLWGVKEYIRPSRWRRTPRWVLLMYDQVRGQVR